MVEVLPAFLAFIAFGVAASFFDLRERRVPNVVNAGFFALALGTWFFENANFWFFVQFSLALVVGYALYKAGVWGAGDAKFFAVANAFSWLGSRQTGAGIAIEIALITCASGFLLFAHMLARNWGIVKRRKKQLAVVFLKTGAWSAAWAIGSFVVFKEFNPVFFAVAVASGLVLSGVKELKELWVEKIGIKQAQPGMALVKPLKVKGKTIGGSAMGLLSAGEIRVLNKAGVRYLLVRATEPFAPFITLAVVILWL